MVTASSANCKLREIEEKAGKATLPAVALTAYSRSEDRRRVLLAGFHSHGAKPVEGDELLAMVGSVAGRVRGSDRA